MQFFVSERVPTDRKAKSQVSEQRKLGRRCAHLCTDELRKSPSTGKRESIWSVQSWVCRKILQIQLQQWVYNFWKGKLGLSVRWSMVSECTIMHQAYVFSFH